MMSNCCEIPMPSGTSECPASQTRGQVVAIETVKAVLRESALRRFTPGQYWFCSASDCDVVYFGADGDQTFTTADLRVPVWQKQPVGRRTICYCFGENELDIGREIEVSGHSQAEGRIRADIAAGRCACEVRNPRGTCCLGDVIAAVRRLEAGVRLRK